MGIGIRPSSSATLLEINYLESSSWMNRFYSTQESVEVDMPAAHEDDGQGEVNMPDAPADLQYNL